MLFWSMGGKWLLLVVASFVQFQQGDMEYRVYLHHVGEVQSVGLPADCFEHRKGTMPFVI